MSHNEAHDPDEGGSEEEDVDQDVKLEHNLILALRKASAAAMARHEGMDDMEPYGVAGITELDGRRRLARRFKRVADEIGYRKFEFNDFKHELDPDDYEPNDDVKWVLKYDSYERSYSLQHRKVDSSQSMPRKAAAYQAAMEPLNKAGFADDGRVYSRVD